MIRIAIDARMAQYSGIGRYIRGVLSAFESSPKQFQYVLLGKSSAREYLPSHFDFVDSNAPVYSINEQFEIPFLAHACACLHVPHYNAPVLWSKKLIVTIHDLIHLNFPHYLSSPLARWYAKTAFPLVVKKAHAVIAVSEHTKKDIIKAFGISEKKIHVVYHGMSPEFLRENYQKEGSDVFQRPYFLYVGLMKAHKNVGVLIDAFRKFRSKTSYSDYRLYLVGVPDLKQKVVNGWLEEIKREPSITLITQPDDEQLRRLYWNASALIFPSLYEGFGFPLLEAMAAEIPIIASRIASIPEIAGESAALYFDPNSSSELEKCMERLVQDDALRQKLVEEGKKRRSLFNWNECAKKTQLVYESILQ